MGTYYPIPEPARIAALELDVAYLMEVVMKMAETLEAATSAVELANMFRALGNRLAGVDKLIAKQQQAIEDLVAGVSELSGASAAHTDGLRRVHDELRDQSSRTSGFNLLGSAVTSPSASEGKRTSSRTKS